MQRQGWIDLFCARAVPYLQTLNPAALIVWDQSAFPTRRLCSTWSRGTGWKESSSRLPAPPSPWTVREQRDLQGEDPNYKVLMIRITCTQVCTSVHKSESFREGEALLGGTQRSQEHRACWICLLERIALPGKSASHPGRMPDPRGCSQGSQPSRNLEAPPGPGPLLHST